MRYNILALIMMIGAWNASAMDLSLKECRSMALQTDENLKIAENNVAGADLDKGVARTAYLPKIDGSGNLFYSLPDYNIGDMMTMQIHGAYMAGLTLQQPIYTGGKITAANRMAAVGTEIAREQLRATKMDVIAEAEKAYWTYVAVLAKVDMTESYLNLIDSVYEVTANAVEIGMSAPQALLRVKTRRSEISYRLNQAEAGANICRMALCRVIGVPDTTAIVPTESLDRNIELPAHPSGVDNRPETIILNKSVDIKRHEVTMARSNFLPTVGMQLGWTAYGNMKMKGFAQDEAGNVMPYTTGISSNGFVGILSVQVPIFHWGEGMKKVKRAKIEVDNAQLASVRNRRLMELESQQNFSNLTTGVDLMESAEAAMNEADENLRLMKDQYEVGLMTLTDLLEAQSQWHTSYSNLIEARTQYRIYYIDYLRSVGELQ